MTDLHEPLEPLESYPDELPPPRQRGDVNLVGLLSVADDLARSLSALKIRVQPHDPKTSLVSPEKARENTEKEIDRLLGTAVYLQRHAHAALLGRCVLGADSKEDCSTEGANLQLNVWDDTTRAGTSSKTAPRAVSPTPSKPPAGPWPTPPAARSCWPSSATTKAPPLPAPSGSGRTTPRSSSTAASPCAPNTASPDPPPAGTARIGVPR
ncbi:hypothetical protein ABCR94_14155 [Streptomyces sp. 21So2-11]|uniref:hypothetical protein n=1 Tax=Streptomyces sp. 21So2-11 TaxID=3144408 RepID=UPI00321B8DC1